MLFPLLSYTSNYDFVRVGEVTVLREYCQGPNKMMYVLPTGGFDPKRHQNILECAKAELEEEVAPSTLIFGYSYSHVHASNTN